MAQPNFNLLWSNFPDHARYPTLTELFTAIGGGLARNINVPGFGPNGNTCAARMSYALNHSDMPIDLKLVKSLGLNALIGADKKPYLFRVSELRTYLARSLGVTPERVKKDFDTAFAGKQGIVAFSVTGWSDASGHVALWDGSSFKEPKYDDFRGLRDDPATAAREAAVSEMTLWAL